MDRLRYGWGTDRPVRGRRTLILGALALAPLAWMPRAFAALQTTRERSLSFYNTHTGESLSTVYRVGDDYSAEAIASIDHILRDHRTDEQFPIDRGLLEQLHALTRVTETGQAFHVISGYRSPKTNAMLAARSGGVAKRSLHIEGQAIDIRLPGLPLAKLRNAAIALKAGGVGYYPNSNFVHLDVGRVRYW